MNQLISLLLFIRPKCCVGGYEVDHKSGPVTHPIILEQAYGKVMKYLTKYNNE